MKVLKVKVGTHTKDSCRQMKVFSKRIISFETLNISESINFHFLVDEGLKQRVCETFLMEMHGQNGWIFCLK